MKASALKYTVLSWVSGLTMAVIALLPFHALLTVWGASLVGHYTALRLWKEILLGLAIIGVLFLLATDHKIRSHTLSRRLVWVILAYAALNLVWGLLALQQQDVTAQALGYGLIVNLRFLAFFLVTWAVALRLSRMRLRWQRLVYWPAAAVVLFGLLQIFILPDDFLRHVGYSAATIPPYETINNDPDYVRIASTLRGANPLGAYLLIPISLLAVLLLRSGRHWRHAALLVGASLVMAFSFSRSAWLGALIAIATILLLSLRSRRAKQLWLAIGGGVLLLAVLLTVSLRHHPHFQNVFLHTESQSAIENTSNDDHIEALESGLQDMRDDPLGSGPGTAGPASVHNDGQTRLAENYFLQVAQETGWLGLILFLLINLGVGALLFVRRRDPLALSLFASLLGLTFINLLSHAWTDDTLAYVWWGLAGIAMAPDRKPETVPQTSEAELNDD